MRLPLPREHGAWAMLITPFVSAVALGRTLNLEVAAAAGAALAVFLMREPVVILWRQARVWREPHPESAGAARWLAAEAVLALGCGGYLLWRLPVGPLLAMGAAAAALTAYSSAMLVNNRGRSPGLQVASAAGLNLAAPLAWLAARGSLAPEAWWLGGMLFAYGAATVAVVHARIDLRTARPDTAPPRSWRAACFAQGALALLALGCAAGGMGSIAAAPALAAAIHALSLRRMLRPAERRVPLRRVGWSAVALSTAYAGILIAGLR